MQVDPDELRMAQVLLGLRLDVDIEFVVPGGGRVGEYAGVHDTKPAHLVRIHPGLDVEDTSMSAANPNYCLWHELVHAMQAERSQRAGVDMGDLYERSMEAAGVVDPDLHAGIAEVDVSGDEDLLQAYRSTPFEFEADLLAARYAVDHSIIVNPQSG